MCDANDPSAGRGSAGRPQASPRCSGVGPNFPWALPGVARPRGNEGAGAARGVSGGRAVAVVALPRGRACGVGSSPRGARPRGNARGVLHPGATRGVALPGSAQPRGATPVGDLGVCPTHPPALGSFHIAHETIGIALRYRSSHCLLLKICEAVKGKDQDELTSAISALTEQDTPGA